MVGIWAVIMMISESSISKISSMAIEDMTNCTISHKDCGDRAILVW